LWQIDKCGVTVVQTAGLSASAVALVAMHKNSQKAEHTTLRRYIKKKIEVPKLNPHVRILMGLPGIGEKLAIDMVKRWGTAWAALTQPVELWIEVLGKAAAYNLAKQLGRPEDEYGDGWR
jgi:ERCC4-type nuclease